jgi:hypothetical protein
MTYNFQSTAQDALEAAALAASNQEMTQAVAREAVMARAEQGRQHVAEHGKLLPILWSHRSPQREMLQFLPYYELVPERMFVTLARVAPTPRGTIGMNHVTQAQLQEHSFADLMAVAAEELRTGLQIEVRGDPQRPDWGKLLTLRRDGPFAASAVALPDFHQQMSDALGTDRLVAGMSDPDGLMVAAQASGWARELQRGVPRARCPDGPLVPTLLLVTESGYTVLAER